ncbi:MAG: hypothetical protein HY537_14030 [Deltaproteobacteria bacterium]|nr:hypothetical protein [Deltaproteobacteria bacterium]
MITFFSRFFYWLTGLFCTFFLLIYFVLPTRTATAFLTAHKLTFAARYNAFLFLTLIAALGCYLLYRIFERYSKGWAAPSSHPALVQPKPRWLAFVQIALSAAILVQAIVGLNSPLDYDENAVGLHISDSSVFEVINPLGHLKTLVSRNHSIANLASVISVAILGENEITLRLPAILFAFFFLLGVNWLCWKHLSPFATVLVMGHLSVNQLLIWYMHSLRGYIALTLFTLIPFIVVLQASRNQEQDNPRKPIGLFAVFFCLSIFTHTLAGVFCAMLFFSYVIWLNFNGAMGSAQVRDYRHKLLIASLFCMPFIGFFMTQDFFHMGNWGAYGSPNSTVGFPNKLLTFYGLSRIWEGKALLLILSGLLIMRARDDWKQDLPTILISASLIFLATMGILIQFDEYYFFARFFFPFLVPSLIWLAESAERVPLQKHGPRLRTFLKGALLFLLIVSPLYSGHAIYANVSLQLEDLYLFVKKVKTEVGHSADVCMTSTGEYFQPLWMQHIYFRKQHLLAQKPELCGSHYQMHFPGGLDSKIIPAPKPDKKRHLLFTDAVGRTFYKIEK